MDLPVLIGAGLLILIGLLNLFAKPLVWRLNDAANRLLRRDAYRTQDWDAGTTVGGLALIFLGIMIFILR